MHRSHGKRKDHFTTLLPAKTILKISIHWISVSVNTNDRWYNIIGATSWSVEEKSTQI